MFGENDGGGGGRNGRGAHNDGRIGINFRRRSVVDAGSTRDRDPTGLKKLLERDGGGCAGSGIARSSTIGE